MNRPRNPQVGCKSEASWHVYILQPSSSHWTSDHVVYGIVFNASTPRHRLTRHLLTLHTDTGLFIFAPVLIFERTLIHVKWSPSCSIYTYHPVVVSLCGIFYSQNIMDRNVDKSIPLRIHYS